MNTAAAAGTGRLLCSAGGTVVPPSNWLSADTHGSGTHTPMLPAEED